MWTVGDLWCRAGRAPAAGLLPATASSAQLLAFVAELGPSRLVAAWTGPPKRTLAMLPRRPAAGIASVQQSAQTCHDSRGAVSTGNTNPSACYRCHDDVTTQVQQLACCLSSPAVVTRQSPNCSQCAGPVLVATLGDPQDATTTQELVDLYRTARRAPVPGAT
jgi:hypothetical protein